MRNILVSLLAGTLFGAGLAVSGMTNPARVRGFLDLFGHWDPTLVFVMGGAVFREVNLLLVISAIMIAASAIAPSVFPRLDLNAQRDVVADDRQEGLHAEIRALEIAADQRTAILLLVVRMRAAFDL